MTTTKKNPKLFTGTAEYYARYRPGYPRAFFDFVSKEFSLDGTGRLLFKKLSHNSCIVIPTTTQPRTGSWYHKLHVAGKDRWAMMNQMRFVSANRLWVRESTLSEEQFGELKKSVARLLGLL